MNPEKLLSRHRLENGLILEMWDLSRHAAGDRWQVVLEARVAIPVTPANLPVELKSRLAEVTAALGPEVLFTKQEVRNFVAEKEVAALLEAMQTWIYQGIQGYLGHIDLPARFLAKRFKEYQDRQRWYRE